MDKTLYEKLRQPFDIRFISWKINNYNADRTRAMITFHVDARAVQHRLNEVLGVDGWSFTFTELEKVNAVHGRLTIYFYNETDGKVTNEDCIINSVTREDVGYPANDERPEWYKAAVSDALKRCAVHFGVALFLYALPPLWIDLNSPGQRYLTKEQDDICRNFLQENLAKMSSKSTVKNK